MELLRLVFRRGRVEHEERVRFEADIRLVVRVEFDADVDELTDPRDEQAAAKVAEQRIAAANHAESELVDAVKAALKHGEVVSELVEEVREKP